MSEPDAVRSLPEPEPEPEPEPGSESESGSESGSESRSESPPKPKPPPLRRNRVFAMWWIVQLTSSLGSAVSGIALPLLALKTSSSPAQAGLIVGAESLGLLIYAPFGGMLADRLSRGRLLQVTNLMFAALALTLGAVSYGRLRLPAVMLVGYGLLSGALASQLSSATAGLVRQIVADEQIEEAYARNNTRTFLARSIGPAIGGALFAISAGLPFLMDGATFVIGALGATLLGRWVPVLGRRADAGVAKGGARNGFWTELTGGVRHIARTRDLRSIAVSIVATNICFSALGFTVLVRMREIGAGSAQIGMMEAAGAVGGLLGSLVATPLIRTANRGLLFGYGTGGVATALAVIVLTDRPLFVGAGFCLMFFVAPVTDVLISAAFVRCTPEELMGRVNAAVRSVAQGLQWAAPGLAGVLIGVVSTHALLAGLGVTMALAYVAVARVSASLRYRGADG